MNRFAQAGILAFTAAAFTFPVSAEVITIKGSSIPLETETKTTRSARKRSSSSARPRDWFTTDIDLVSSKYEDERWSDWDHDHLELFDHVEIGTRIITIDLQDDHQDIDPATGNGFVGTITDLEAINDSSPTRWFIDYFATPYWGFELSYDKIGAETKTDPNHGSGVKSDGDLELSGPILSFIGRYPNQTAFTPYGGVGFAFYSSDFSEEAHWALGYSDPAEYAANGSPTTLQPGRRSRTMNVDDATGFVLYGGALWSLHKDWAIDLYVRYMDVEVDAEFIGKVRDIVETRRTGTFTMEHIGYGLSLHYVF